jgi:hypothetical protein
MKKLCLFLLVVLCSCGVGKSIKHLPQTEGYDNEMPIVTKYAATSFSYKNNFLVKNTENNLWEMYVEGDALQRGLIIGSLSDSLIKQQEKIFFGKIKQMVPSEFKLRLLRQFLKVYNRKLYKNVSEEYQTELYGLSRFVSKDFDDIAPPYLRTLYLHGAHDIGHALSDLSLVGCTSFAVWNEKSEDGKLLIGRNLDFYAGDDFAENKVVYFIKPDLGHPYMSVSWPGMIGVVSGMNREGLTVTINAGKSDIPWAAKTPIAILAREILQYAKTIDEAIAIAKKREVFVSESIMIGSANDGKAVLLEVSPNHFGIYDVANSSELICANHFQSDTYKDDKKNTKQILESHSKYRFERMEELLDVSEKINPTRAVKILRDKNGLKDKSIGFGNEKALNQLLAHHGIVFKPEQKLVWISANPYQLGEFVCYDLNKVFGCKVDKDSDSRVMKSMAETSLNIAKDTFLETKEYADYEQFRIKNRVLDKDLESKKELSDEYILEFKNLNPELWSVYYKAGKYYQEKKQFQKAFDNFEIALTKEITTLPDRKEVEKQLKKVKRKLR